MNSKRHITEPVRYKDTPYLVYIDGRVFSERRNKFLSPGKSQKYRIYCFSVSGKRFAETKHRLIAICYIPNPNNYKLVRHLDDNAENNSLENLKWGTDYDNAQDGKRNGTIKNRIGLAGSSNPLSKITEEQVYDIRRRRHNGEKYMEIAKDYTISVSQIQLIAARKRWKHLPEKQTV